MKNSVFSVRGVIKHYETLPLIAIIAGAIVTFSILIPIAIHRKPDVQFFNRKPMSHLDVDFQSPKKLRDKQQGKIEFPQEIDNLRKEVWNSKND